MSTRADPPLKPRAERLELFLRDTPVVIAHDIQEDPVAAVVTEKNVFSEEKSGLLQEERRNKLEMTRSAQRECRASPREN
jgi:hypothetical protein